MRQKALRFSALRLNIALDVGSSKIPRCPITAATAFPAERIFLPSICSNVDLAYWSRISMLCARLYARFEPRDRFTLIAGSCCPITCIAFGRYHPAMLIILPGGRRSKSRLRNQSQKRSRYPLCVLRKAKGVFGNEDIGNTRFGTIWITLDMWIMCISIRLSIGTLRGLGIGHIPRFRDLLSQGFIRLVGRTPLRTSMWVKENKRLHTVEWPEATQGAALFRPTDLPEYWPARRHIQPFSWHGMP